MATNDAKKFHEMLAKVVGPVRNHMSSKRDDDMPETPFVDGMIMMSDDGLVPPDYPVDGEIFDEVLIVKIPYEDPPFFLVETLDPKIQNLLYEAGSPEMDQTLFRKEDIISEPGLYVLKLQVIFQYSNDWETSTVDKNPGFQILEIRKV